MDHRAAQIINQAFDPNTGNLRSLAHAARALSQMQQLLNQQQPIPAAFDHPPQGMLYEEVPRVPSSFLVTPERPAVAPGAQAATQIRFQGVGPGWLVGMRGIGVDLTAGAVDAGEAIQATIQMRLSFNSGENIVTNGDAEDFISFGQVFAQSKSFSPLLRYVRDTEILQIQYQNIQPAGGATITPLLSFAFFRMRLEPTEIEALKRSGMHLLGTS